MEYLQHQFQRYFVENGASQWWLNGLKSTLCITVIALLIGVVLGFTVAIIRSQHEQTGKLKILNGICRVYLSVIRVFPKQKDIKKQPMFTCLQTKEYCY